MATEFADLALNQIRDVINRLQAPVPDLQTLLALLAAPLDALHLLPPHSRHLNTSPLQANAIHIPRHAPAIQRALLEHIVPTWEPVLAQERHILLLEQYFCPDAFAYASRNAGEITLLAYSTILALPLTAYSIRILARLAKEYPIDRLHRAVFSLDDASRKQTIAWEDCVRNVVAVPAKVANALGGKGDIPPLLEHGTYFQNVAMRSECLILSLCHDASPEHISSLTFLLGKLANLGLFPPSQPTSRSQPSFFHATLPTIRRRLDDDKIRLHYSAIWSKVITSLPSSFTQQAVLVSLFASTTDLSSGTDASDSQRGLVKREARLLRSIVGSLSAQNGDDLWANVSAVILNRDWSEGRARVFACWVAGARKGYADTGALQVLLSMALDTWSSSDHIKYSLLSRHRYVTVLLLVTISYFPPTPPAIQSLSMSPLFMSGIGTYIGHMDNSVRRCGMLVAEIVAQRAGKKLDFGDWEGDADGRGWARAVRNFIVERDADFDETSPAEDNSAAEEVDIEEIFTEGTRADVAQAREPVLAPPSSGYDSDDSLTGYASPSSSRSPSPTPSELADIERDPSLAVGVKNVARPVYLAQLGALVRGTGGLKKGDEEQEADRIEMALSCAEELIRRKRAYGMELDENAVNLVYGFVSLQDNFDLEGFDEKRQAALNALVVCAPRKAAPCIIEEFFKNQYSSSQRYVMLNALAIGARELASLPIPQGAAPPSLTNKPDFPSKTLPGSLHQKYLAAGDQVQYILDGISRTAIDRGKDDSADKVPALVRERNLRIRKPPKVTEVTSVLPSPRPPTAATTFTEVAAEFFIAPLINRFWLFLRDEQTREARTALRETLHRYHAGGTGLILNAVVLIHFLRTLALLVHAAQNAPEWLSVVAPEALELAVTLGTRPISEAQTEDEDAGAKSSEGKQGKEAALLTTALELALVVLDGCLELDGGRSLGLDHTALLFGAGEWAGQVFGQLEKGTRVEGGGGVQEVRLRRAAAGVLLKVDDLTSKWRRSMVDVR